MNNGSILVADDDRAIRTVLNQALSRAGYSVRVASNVATLWKWITDGEGDLVITDVIMPDQSAFDILPNIKKLRPNLPIVVMSANNTFMTAIKASELGAYEYLPKPFDLNELIAISGRAIKESRSQRTSGSKPAPDIENEQLPLIGRSAAMQDIYRTLARLMQSDLTVLVSGESGTGKELVARALHDFGKRRKGPFVAINMAAIPKELIESELFGHEMGAFTGAKKRQSGLFEQAEGGSLFLDEIGDMPMDSQTRLLRVLQQGEYTTVGGRTPIKTNVRIVAATNQNLFDLVQQGLFREDLYYRLNVVPIQLPPLRARLEDIPDLVNGFLREAKQEGLPDKSFSPEALQRMKEYSWPGNVRELQNFVRRLIVLTPEETVDEEQISFENLVASSNGASVHSSDLEADLSYHVERHVTSYFVASGQKLPAPGLYHRIMREIEPALLSVALAATGGNQIKCAHVLGLNRNTLRKKIRELGIDVIKGPKS